MITFIKFIVTFIIPYLNSKCNIILKIDFYYPKNGTEYFEAADFPYLEKYLSIIDKNLLTNRNLCATIKKEVLI